MHRFEVWAPRPQRVELVLEGRRLAIDDPRHRAILDWHRHLIALRRREPALTDPSLPVEATFTEGVLRWSRGSIRMVANLSEAAVEVGVRGPVLAASPGVSADGDRTTLAVDSVVICSSPGQRPR